MKLQFKTAFGTSNRAEMYAFYDLEFQRQYRDREWIMDKMYDTRTSKMPLLKR